jgi:outer membrane lipoprotein-sorting protein
MKAYLLIAAAVVIQPAASLAQTSPAGAGFQQAQSLGAGVGVGMLWPTAMGGRWMAGKPYSATAITHTVQLLADGSQIERTQSEALYRDDQGRTRSESNNGKFIRIVDPGAGLAYNLDTAAKTAGTQEIMMSQPGPQGVSKQAIATRPTSRTPFEFASEQAKHTPSLTVEDLGTQAVNGVQAQGARTTNTIPVGAIGNNRELKTVSERWESRDLGLLIKTVTTDPRFGTTTYDLTNIVQGPPDPSLFRVPSDYTVSPPPKRN